MTISIQPLSAGQPVGELTTIDFAEFLTLNDGFSPKMVADMTEVLKMGAGYLTAFPGLFRSSPPLDLGSFRYGWLARFYARAYLWAYPWRAVRVEKRD